MLNNDYKITTEPKKKYDVLPEDDYEAIIFDINPKQKKKYLSDEMEDILDFEFHITEEGQYKERKVWKDVRRVISESNSRYPASFLYRVLVAVFGKWESPEITGEQLNSIIGKKVRLTIRINQNNNKYNKITDILAPKNGEKIEDEHQNEEMPF